MTTSKKRSKLIPGYTVKQEQELEKNFNKIGMKFKRPSDKLEAALNALGLDFGKLQPRVDRVFEIGRKEGYPDMMIGDMIRDAMKNDYSTSTIQRVLPETAKREYHRNENKTVTSQEKSVKVTELENEPKVSSDVKQEGPDKYRFYQETIDAKNKLLKQNDEEIKGLKNEIATLKTKVAKLEDEIKRLKK